MNNFNKITAYLIQEMPLSHGISLKEKLNLAVPSVDMIVSARHGKIAKKRKRTFRWHPGPLSSNFTL